MNDDAASDPLLTVARAIAVGDDIEWDAHARACGPADSDVLLALQGLQRIATAQRRLLEAPPLEFSRWAHLAIVARRRQSPSLLRCRARDALGRQLGLLLIGPIHGAAEEIEALLRIARVTTTVHHPNWATVHGADYAQDYVGLWYQDEPGDTLEDVVRSGHPFDDAAAAQILREIARAVSALHSAGIVHGHISPACVTVTPDRRIVLLPAISVAAAPQADVAALGEMLRALHPRPDRLERQLRSVSSAAALEAALERACRTPWWRGEWVIGFVAVAALIALALWLAA
jgi:serine/threonine protein kinase